MRRIFLAIALAIIALSVSTCCAADVLTSENMKKMMIDSAKNYQTYRFALDANVSSEKIDLQNPGGMQANTTTMTGQGAVNITSRAMAVTINYNQGASGQSSEIYALDDSLYVLQNDAWSKLGISSSDELWSGQKIVKRQEDLVNLAQLTLDGSDEIEGDYCYRLSIVPDSNKGAALLALQISPMLAASFSTVDASSLFRKISDNSRIIGWKVWISRDGHLLRKSSIQAEINLTPEILEAIMKGLGKNSMHMMIDFDVVYHDYNAGIEIHLPEEAKKATTGLQIKPTGELNQAGNTGEIPESAPSNPIGTDQQSSDSLAIYQEFYDFGQGTQTAAGPVRFDIYGAEPTYLIINGQSRPYDPNYVPINSLWIGGRTSWTQYIKCPMNAQIMMLAFSNGGPATMIETYADGHQDVNQYNFYLGYTQLVFVANAVGRHTLAFYTQGQQSNTIVLDVIPYGGSYASGYTPPAGLPYSSPVKISIGNIGRGTSQSQISQPEGIVCSIIGTWRFDNVYNIDYSDGRLEAKNAQGEVFDRGVWKLIDASKRQYAFTWQSGWQHTFTLSADCSTLDGYGKYGNTEVQNHGTRVVSGVNSGGSLTTTGRGYGQMYSGDQNQGSGSNPLSGSGQVLIDSADQGFYPNALPEGYGDPYSQPGRIFVDSTANGFDPMDQSQGEAI